MQGYNSTTFTSALQLGFRTALAATLNKTVQDIAITRVSSIVTSGRRLLQAGAVIIDFTVKAGTDADASAVNSALTSSATLSTLATNLQAQNIVGISASSLAVTQPTTTATPTSAAAANACLMHAAVLAITAVALCAV